MERLVADRPQVASSLELFLYCLPFVHWYDGFVGILHEILREFSTILFSLFRNGVKAVFLLKEHIPSVGYVREDHLNIGVHPLIALPCVNALFHQDGYGVFSAVEETFYRIPSR